MGTLHPAARDLERSAPFQFQRADDEPEGDGRSLKGYAAVFGQDTEIDSWEGQFVETIRKGAFRKTIRESTPVMQFDHGRHPLIGSLPIGSINDLREDDQGLYVEGRITDNWLMQPVRDAIAEKTVNGMSFRFEVVRDEWRDKAGKLVKPEELMDLLWMPGDRGPLRRELIELKCRELGPVVFPAYVGTSVSVRSLAESITEDPKLRRDVIRSLVMNTPPPRALEDLQVRRQVAHELFWSRPTLAPSGPRSRAVTFEALVDGGFTAAQIEQVVATVRSRTDAAPLLEHPAPESTTDGAPLEREHPPATSTTDAPPSDGHPSTPETPRSARLRSHIREIAGLMKEKLPPIEEDRD